MRRRYHRGLSRRRSGIAFAVMLASFGCYALPPDDAITPEMDHPVAVDDALPIATTVGCLSLVIPNFAREPFALDQCAVYRLCGGL